MRILVTGGEGQVARSLAQCSVLGCELAFARRPELDLADPASIEREVAKVAPDVIISAAAYTQVDQAEDEPDLAMKINGDAPGALGRAAAKVGARIIHLSTDYVFDGSLDRPYAEDDPVSPIGVYGASKLAGEDAVKSSGADYLILRTAWVYSAFGANFVKTMLRLAADRDRVNVVSDQIGCPTSAHDIAQAIFAVLNCWRKDPGMGLNGVFHFAGSGETSWAGLAEATFSASSRRCGPSAEVEPILTAQWPTKARRPANSRLSSVLFQETFGHSAPPWTASVDRVVGRLLG